MALSVILFAGAALGQQAPASAAPMSAEAQASAMAAQLAIQQQQAAIQQQLQQQVEAGRQQTGKNLATTAPKMSTVEELNQKGPCAKTGEKHQGDCQEKLVAAKPRPCGDASGAETAAPCSRQQETLQRKPKAFIIPEPGSEIAPPGARVATAEALTTKQPTIPDSARPNAPELQADVTTTNSASARPVEVASAAAIAAPAAAPAPPLGITREIPPAPLVVALPVSSLPQPPEIAGGTAKLPSPHLTELREHLKQVESKYDVSKIGDRGIGKGLDFWSLEKEQQLGRGMAADVERDSRLITDPLVVEYVNRVGQNLVRNSDAKVPFIIKVIDNDEVNAFALPGGFFYVNSGLIMAASDEAQLAGVMAHEIAHVAARHATRNDTRTQILNIASMPLIFLGGPVGYAVREAVQFALPMSYLKFNRNMEREADLLGLEYAYATGYDPEEFVRFFESLKAREKEKKGFLAKAFSTHPMTGDRIKRAQKAIASYLPPRQDYILDTSDFEQVKTRLAAITHQSRIESSDPEHPTLRRRDSQPK